MRRSVPILALMLVLWSNPAPAQNTTASNSERKVSVRVLPAYPELAKKMHIHGVVRIEAMVRPNGSVKTTRVLGGNPVLVEAAQDAVSRWKFEPSQNETTEVLQVSFEGR